MKKTILFIIIAVLFIPCMVHAESYYLYDVLKNEAEANGLAKEYTGEHKDSFTREPTDKIYHFYAENDEEGIAIKEKNNVIFGGFCWEMIRTTDTGGVKIIYNGVPVDGKCTSTSNYIAEDCFNSYQGSLANAGYKHDTIYNNYANNYFSLQYNAVYGNSVTYSDGIYTLIDPQTSVDNTHRYTCNTTSTTCSYKVNFVLSNNSKAAIIEIKNGVTSINELLNNMLRSSTTNAFDSTIKKNTDSWYETNLKRNYANYLEETIYCGDRTISNYGPFNENGGTIEIFGKLYFRNYNENDSLICENEYDQYSTNNSQAYLKYPIGHMSVPEVKLLNNNEARKGRSYWLISPCCYQPNGAENYYVNEEGEIAKSQLAHEIGYRPAVSLKKGIKYSQGDGSKENPYKVKPIAKKNITVNNDNNKGTYTISNSTSVEEDSTVTLSVISNDGYVFESLTIKDENNETIEYETNEDILSFIMPDTNVTITINYRKTKYDVGIQIVNQTKDITINLDDITKVVAGTEVVFKVTPIKGYKIKSIQIIDENDEDIEFTETENINEYQFIMPSKDVLIIPKYEKVTSAVFVEDNPNTKEITIKVNDVTAVVYQEKVKFTVVPEKGYEVENIIITDTEGNKISYKKTNNENEYEFVMPDTDILIKPVYRKIEKEEPIINPYTGINYYFLIAILGIGLFYYFIRKKKTA